MLHALAFAMPGLPEWIIIAAIGLLLFGKRLPEVGRSLGKGIVEFKKGLRGIEEDVEQHTDSAALPPSQTIAPNAGYKFDPYTGKPIQKKFDPYTGKPLDAEPPQPPSA